MRTMETKFLYNFQSIFPNIFCIDANQLVFGLGNASIYSNQENLDMGLEKSSIFSGIWLMGVPKSKV